LSVLSGTPSPSLSPADEELALEGVAAGGAEPPQPSASTNPSEASSAKTFLVVMIANLLSSLAYREGANPKSLKQRWS
jgi:hypothetical protein